MLVRASRPQIIARRGLARPLTTTGRFRFLVSDVIRKEISEEPEKSESGNAVGS
jgi:hypothetical protein